MIVTIDTKGFDRLHNMLAAAGVSKLRRRLMYLAVRAVGWRSWRTLP